MQDTTLLHCRRCEEGCLDSDFVKGKIVLCDDYDRGNTAAYKAGALGSVLYNFRNTDDFSTIPPFAATTLNEKTYSVVMSYMNSTRYRFFWMVIRGLSQHVFSL